MSLARDSLSDALRLLLFYPYRWTVPFMPPAREMTLSRYFGRLIGVIEPKTQRRIAANLARVFPGRLDVQSIARECLEHQLQNAYLCLSFEKLDPSTLPYYIHFEGLPRLEEALTRGNGCILALPHMGPMLLPLFGLGLLGYRVAQISAQEEPEESSRAANAAYRVRRYLESLMPAAVINARSYLRPTLRRLKAGEVVMGAYDGTGGGLELGRRVRVHMLGQQVWFPVGLIYLAMRSQAPLLPMVLLPGAHQLPYRAVIGPELQIEARPNLRETLEHNAQRLAQVLEAHILKHPACWHLWADFEPGRMVCPAEVPR